MSQFIREVVSNTLATDAGILAVFSANSIEPLHVDEDSALPALTVALVSDVPGRNLDGPDGASRSRFHFTIHSKILADGQAGAEAARQLLDGLKNQTIVGPTGAPVYVLESWKADEHDEEDDSSDGTGRPYLRTVLDYVIRYRLARPTRLP